MNATTLSKPAKNPDRAAAPQPPAPFAKPGPGSWQLDAQHCERPMPLFVQDAFAEQFPRGFKEGLEKYGALLETIEARFVNGFIYTCPRPVGAPPEPKGLPPKPVFKLLTLLHPGIRKRIKRSEKAWVEKPWREDVRLYLETWTPAMDKLAAAVRDARMGAMDDRALADHMGAVHRLLCEETFMHHRMNASRVVPVGDFLAQAGAWTGAPVAELLAGMRGFSPQSRGGLVRLEAAAEAVRADAAALAAVNGEGDAETVLAGLERRQDAVGRAVRAWVEEVGNQITGFSPAYPTLRETPSTLIEALRGALAGAKGDDAAAAGRKALERLRARVPEERRADFDALVEEARAVYFVRDHSCMHSCEVFGITRLALLEAGRRLVSRGLADDPEAAMDAALPELQSLLRDGKGPSQAELAARLAWRRGATLEQAPETLGPKPGDPPPADWLPPASARLFRAVDTYIGAMFNERQDVPKETAVVRGLPASGGKRTGTARLVLEPGDFDKVGPGDVLVARLTTPTYNVLLPLLAGIVTDRGGILSHPAIVSREFGIPGVVGTRNATALIPDGAKVEIDGDAGTVRVLG